MYKYKAIVTKVYDGDTVTVDIDLGFGIWKKKESIRLHGIDTPELRGGSTSEKLMAVRSRDYLLSLVMNKEIVIESNAKDKYGRYLCVIYLKGENVNRLMLNNGGARVYYGGKKEEWVF